jgi:hypothetical protein
MLPECRERYSGRTDRTLREVCSRAFVRGVGIETDAGFTLGIEMVAKAP